MFPLMETMSKYGPAQYSGNTTVELESVADSSEYIYVDDPKDGNDSSANEDNIKAKIKATERDSTYTSKNVEDSDNEVKRVGSSISSLMEIDKEENGKSSDEDEAYFALPWRLLPAKVLEDLEFFKNAGK